MRRLVGKGDVRRFPPDERQSRTNKGRSMRRSIPLLVLALMALSVLAFDNEPTGFRAMKWGAGVPPDWQKVSKRPKGIAFGRTNEEIYVNPKDDLKIGDAKVDSIYYGFWKGKFCCVWISFQGLPNFNALRDVYVAEYGPGKVQRNTNPGGDLISISWRGKTANVTLEKSGASPGSLVVQSASLWEQRTAEIVSGMGS